MRDRFHRAGLMLGLASLLAGLAWQPTTSEQAAGLRIVVIEGEGAVNIIQQNTAVRAVVEVRDRNDQPVAGAIVRFAIQGGRASFGGARTLTITTNAAGRAAVTSLNATGGGALHISASAAFQGQTAVATITQTNVLTAAQAAAASGAGGSGGASTGSAGAGGGAGGGLSATTIGVVGGAAAGGALIVKEVVLPQGTAYTGTYAGSWEVTFVSTNPPVTCLNTMTANSTLTIRLEKSGGSVKGEAKSSGTEGVTPNTCTGFANSGHNGWDGAPVSGTPANITFSYVDTYLPQPVPGLTVTATYLFTGSLTGDVINGTLTRTDRQTSQNINALGSVVFPISLRGQ